MGSTQCPKMSWELGYKHEVLESDSTFVNSYLKSHGGPTLSALAWNLFIFYFFYFFKQTDAQMHVLYG